MAYIPDWLPLPEALQRVMATGVGEEDAKTCAERWRTEK
jgi:hypothetical protein